MQISRYAIFSKKITKRHAVALIADIHGGDFERVIELLRTISPDLIAVPGDIEGGGERERYINAFLSACVSVAPTFVSPGNHDRHLNAVTAACTGAVLLDNAHTVFGELNIGGLTSGSLGVKKHGRLMRTPDPDIGFAKEFAALPGFKLMLSHHPEYYPRFLKSLDSDLIVSGHAHGGQWRFFGRGVFAPGQGLFPKYTSGLHDGRLVVTRGTADHNGIPRFFNPHEICAIDLMPEEQK